MRIAMVSEHASPLAAIGGADAGGQNVHVAALARRSAERGHDVTVYTRRDDPAAARPGPGGPGRDCRARTAPDPPHPWPKTSCCRTWPSSAITCAAMADGAAGHRARALLDEWPCGSTGGARTSAFPCCRPSTLWAPSSGGTRVRRTPARRSRLRLETRLARDAALVVATCADEVTELAALGVPAQQSPSCRAAWTSTGSPRDGRVRRATAGIASCLGRAAGRTQRRRDHYPRAGRGGRRGTDHRRRPGTRSPMPSWRGCAAVAQARRARSGASRRPDRAGTRCRRCCARRTWWSACRGTSRSGWCRWRRWPAPSRWSPPPSAA